MQRLDLNLATNPFRNNTLLWIGYILATVLLVTFTAWNGRSFVVYRARLLELQRTAGDFETQQRDLETRSSRALTGIRRYDLETLQVQASKANEMIEWKAFSWTRLLNELERIQPYQVRMNAIRPVFDASRSASADEEEVRGGAMPVAIEGTARDYGAFAEFEHALQEDPHFGRVLPQRLTKANNGEFVFHLQFLYYPAVESASDPAIQAAAQADAEIQPGRPAGAAAVESGAEGDVAAASGDPAATAGADPGGGDDVPARAQEEPPPPGSAAEEAADATAQRDVPGRASPGRPGDSPRAKGRVRRPTSTAKEDGS